jgi:lactate permease
MWNQLYDPFGSVWISALVAAIPLLIMMVGIGFLHVKAHYAALLGLAASLAIAMLSFGMPGSIAGSAALYGAAFGLLPIGWLILNVLFLYRLTEAKGHFKVLQDNIAGITDDRRLQLLLIAFCFGAFFEGCAGFGAPVAISAAMLVGLGFRALTASCLSLIANTAPVAFGSLGTPIIALAGVTGLPLHDLSAMVGRQLPFFSVIVPFWLIAAFAGWKGMKEIWPAIAVTGISFAIPQFLVSNYHGPWLVDIVAALVSIGCLVLFLRKWQPANIWRGVSRDDQAALDAGELNTDRDTATQAVMHDSKTVRAAWTPWAILCVLVFLWGLPQTKVFLDSIFAMKIPFPGLHEMVVRVPPVVPAPEAEKAIFNLNLLSATGTAILLAALISAAVMGVKWRELFDIYRGTLRVASISLLTISAMLSLGYVTRYSGIDSSLGLAFASSGVFYPFFGTLLGWLGVAVTGSDTASNVLFGGLQRTSAEQLGLSPTLMAAANSSGGVMGKMIDAQSIVVASTATGLYGKEGEILRYVFFHSIALASLIGLLVTAQAYVPPFTEMVVGP